MHTCCIPYVLYACFSLCGCLQPLNNYAYELYIETEESTSCSFSYRKNVVCVYFNMCYIMHRTAKIIPGQNSEQHFKYLNMVTNTFLIG